LKRLRFVVVPTVPISYFTLSVKFDEINNDRFFQITNPSENLNDRIEYAKIIKSLNAEEF